MRARDYAWWCGVVTLNCSDATTLFLSVGKTCLSALL